ncbi:LamG domain-containing protein [Porticoccaceae bacterium]|nr:LamG domain-containing protein [Porticoccaceae bacterium]
MSLLDDVSIVVTPNGYKAGELYGVIPVPTEGSEEVTNGNFATDSDWNLGSSWSISGGKANYDAVSTGVELRQLMSSIDVGQLVNIVFEVSDIEDGKDAFFKLECSGAPESVFTYTKFSAGTYTYSHAITGGFNRLTFTALNSSTGGYFSIDNVSVKKYTSADMDVTRATDATRVNQSGLIENVLSNVPRIDYTGGGCPHILAEPQRTNLITYSSDFSNAIWTKSGSSVTLNATTSPDGTINADKLVEDTSTGGHQIQSITSSSNSTIYTTSVFVKYAGREWIRFTDAQSSNRIHFNTLTGVFGTVSGTVIDYNKTALENGWYKLSLTTTSVATAYTPRIALAEADNDVSYTGDGVSGVYIYGCSLEEGSYATSYIPTSGSTVTRNQDIFTRDGIGSLIGQTEGTFFIELSKPVLEPDSYYLISLNNAASNSDDNSVTIGFDNGSDDFYIRLRANASSPFTDNNRASLANTFYKIAIAYKSGQSLIYIDGNSITPNSGNLSTAFTFSATLDNLSFDYNGNNSLPFFGKVKQLQVYNTALTDEQLLQLTGTSGTDFYESYAEMASALTYTIQ